MAREIPVSMAHDGAIPREEPQMFDPWCPTCSARVLLTARRLVSLGPTPTGHRARLRCWCGTVVAMDVDRLGASAA